MDKEELFKSITQLETECDRIEGRLIELKKKLIRLTKVVKHDK